MPKYITLTNSDVYPRRVMHQMVGTGPAFEDFEKRVREFLATCDIRMSKNENYDDDAMKAAIESKKTLPIFLEVRRKKFILQLSLWTQILGYMTRDDPVFVGWKEVLGEIGREI